MGSHDPRIDAYIAKSAPFAQPILEHIRAVMHDACPDVEETIKWGFPHFDYHGMMCSTASFKAHCALNFWLGRQVLGDEMTDEAMGQFGRITSLKDLPNKTTLSTHRCHSPHRAWAQCMAEGSLVQRVVQRAQPEQTNPMLRWF